MRATPFLAVSLLFLAGACTPGVSVVTPDEGAMIAPGADVDVIVEASRGTVSINGAAATSEGGAWTATVAEVDGLGFAWAQVDDTEAVAVRSWHQGTFATAGSRQEEALQVALSEDAMCDGEPSICSVVQGVVQGEDLAGFVDNPLNVSGVQITVESAVSDAVTVQVGAAEAPAVTLRLEGLLATYSADAWLYHSSGTARFESVEITGTLGFDGAEASLAITQVTASDAVVQDDGGLPASVVDLLAAALQAELERAMADAAAAACEQVVGELLAQAGPLPAVGFERPVSAAATPTSVYGSTAGLVVAYDARITAEQPSVASAQQGFLVGSEAAVQPGETPLVAALGSPLIDALAFAAWDAGNLEGLVFTREDLQDAGLPDLAFPYDRFREAELRLALPPLLVWRDDGPWLEVGGIVAELSVRTARDATVRTAAYLPVRLEVGDDGLYLRPDPDRAVEVEPLAFQDLNELADPEQAGALVTAAIPAVTERVFGTLPAVVLPELEFTTLSGGEGPGIGLEIEAVEVDETRWLLRLGWTDQGR